MARLVAVRRSEDYPFERRQIPLSVDDNLTVDIPRPFGLFLAIFGGDRSVLAAILRIGAVFVYTLEPDRVRDVCVRQDMLLLVFHFLK